MRVLLTIEKEGKHLTGSQRVAIWTKYTGYGRREYFRLKAEQANTFYGRARVSHGDIRAARQEGKISETIKQMGSFHTGEPTCQGGIIPKQPKP